MNPTNETVLQDFLGQLVLARGVSKDPDADALIQRAVSSQPDAAYLLVQRALLVEQALDKANARVAELEHQDAKQGQKSGGLPGALAATAAGGFLFHGLASLLGDEEQGASHHLLTDDAELADASDEDRLGGFFDGDGSDEGVFGAES